MALSSTLHYKEHGETIIYIDDTELSMEEFAEVLSCLAGWGMRLIIVPDDRLDEEPEIEIREPNEEWPRIQ